MSSTWAGTGFSSPANAGSTNGRQLKIRRSKTGWNCSTPFSVASIAVCCGPKRRRSLENPSLNDFRIPGSTRKSRPGSGQMVKPANKTAEVAKRLECARIPPLSFRGGCVPGGHASRPTRSGGIRAHSKGSARFVGRTLVLRRTLKDV